MVHSSSVAGSNRRGGPPAPPAPAAPPPGGPAPAPPPPPAQTRPPHPPPPRSKAPAGRGSFSAGPLQPHCQDAAAEPQRLSQHGLGGAVIFDGRPHLGAEQAHPEPLRPPQPVRQAGQRGGGGI